MGSRKDWKACVWDFKKIILLIHIKREIAVGYQLSDLKIFSHKREIFIVSVLQKAVTEQ